jgi:hypothetical protein
VTLSAPPSSKSKECKNSFDYFSFADEGDTILRNIGKHSLNITASHPRRMEA